MGAWDGLPADHSPFKVVCSAHGGTQLVERGGAFGGADGFVSVRWKPRAGRAVPESGTGVVHGDGSRTFVLECPECRRPKAVRQDHLVRLLRERAAAGDVDHKGRVCLDLAELAF